MAVLILLTSVNASAQTVIWTEAFNNSSSFTASGSLGYEDSDEYLRIKTSSASTWNYTGNSGNFIAGCNIDDYRGSNNRAEFTWPNIDIAGYNNLEFSRNFASMENKIDGTDRIEVHYRVNNGNWKRIIHLKGQNSELKEVLQNIDLAQSFTTISSSINDLGTDLDIRVPVRNFTKEDEDFALDNLAEWFVLLFFGTFIGVVAINKHQSQPS